MKWITNNDWPNRHIRNWINAIAHAPNPCLIITLMRCYWINLCCLVEPLGKLIYQRSNLFFGMFKSHFVCQPFEEYLGVLQGRYRMSHTVVTLTNFSRPDRPVWQCQFWGAPECFPKLDETIGLGYQTRRRVLYGMR
jgi:hypothetical protein